MSNTTRPRYPFPLAGRREISSPHNPYYRLLKAILEGKGIRKYCLALISGEKVVREIAQNYPQRIGGWVLSNGKHRFEVPLGNTGQLVLNTTLFKSIDIWGTGGPIAIVRVDPFPVWRDMNDNKGCTLFVPFQDPGNVGTVIRSAAAFAVSRIVLLKEAAHPYHPKSSRAASGALFELPFYQGPSIEELHCKNIPLFLLDSAGKDISTIDFPARFGLLAGLEGGGLPQYMRSFPTIRIPLEPHIESLNAATATAITLFCWYKKKQ